MRSQIIRYDDWGRFIQMDKREWLKIKRWLKAHGVEVTETDGDGRVTKYRRLEAIRRDTLPAP